MPIPQLGVRIGIVTKVGRTFIEFQFIDRIDEQTHRTPIPHPYAGRGGGVLVGVEKDSLILVSNGPAEKWYCIAVIPDHNFYFDLGGALNIKNEETSYPTLSEGEIAIKSNIGSQINLTKNGNIKIDAGAGLSLGDIELSRSTNTLFTRIENRYNFGEYGRSIEGIIKRDLNTEEKLEDTESTNFLDSESYDRFLTTIGRNVKNEVQHRTTRLIKQTVRNPALIEKREIIYEYADSFNVKDFSSEVNATLNLKPDKDGKLSERDISLLQKDTSSRYNRRTDVLNLNQRNFNHLIEKIEGTVADIYGNVLDINRNIINIPDIEELKSDGNDKNGLKRIYDHHRRGIKLHYEINSRKDIKSSEPPDEDRNRNNAKNFSRWSIDVDGEGLTKINIPATSETGNIPILSRYFTLRDESDGDNKKDSGSFRASDPNDKDKTIRDIRIKQFGVGEIEIKNSDYVPKSVDNSSIFVGTAYHNLTNIASSIFNSGGLADPNIVAGVSNKPFISGSIDNKISDIGGPTTGANAGGRSVHMNLDGSLEMSIGADTVDKKSVVIDTQGSVVSHFGRDNNGRSIIQQTDGDVIIQVGGSGTDVIDDRFGTETDRPGRVEIHLNRGRGKKSQKILIDENGLTLDIQGNFMLKSSGDMILESGGRLLLNGELIFAYGASDTDTRTIVGSETKFARTGRPQFT